MSSDAGGGQFKTDWDEGALQLLIEDRKTCQSHRKRKIHQKKRSTKISQFLPMVLQKLLRTCVPTRVHGHARVGWLFRQLRWLSR